MSLRHGQINWLVLTAFLFSLVIACAKKSDAVVTNDLPNTPAMVRPGMSGNSASSPLNVDSTQPQNRLESLLAAGDWKAVEAAKREGVAALPIVKRFAKDNNYVVRQIVISCLEAIGDAGGGDVLAAGLADPNVNVRLAAARALGERPYPGTSEAILNAVADSWDEAFRELAVRAAGFVPGAKTAALLHPLAVGDTALARAAINALAKIGDEAGRKMLAERLSAPLPRTRYEALEGLCYVGDKRHAARARAMLSDKAVGLRIGSARNPKNRRVADQATDSLVCLLQLEPSFTTSPEKIYSDQEIAAIRKMVK